jgi:hypothetical protein
VVLLIVSYIGNIARIPDPRPFSDVISITCNQNGKERHSRRRNY